MDDLINRTVYHPAIAHPAIYLTEIMSRVDWSIGAAIVVLLGALSVQLLRMLQAGPGK
jgi:hypothetical protein